MNDLESELNALEKKAKDQEEKIDALCILVSELVKGRYIIEQDNQHEIKIIRGIQEYEQAKE